MSQNDTIELRGFDESDKPGKRKMSAARVKRVKDWSKKKESTIVEDKEKTEETTELNESLPSNGQQAKRGDAKNNEPDATLPKVESLITQPEHHQTFDFDEFFKGEHIPGLLTVGWLILLVNLVMKLAVCRMVSVKTLKKPRRDSVDGSRKTVPLKK